MPRPDASSTTSTELSQPTLATHSTHDHPATAHSTLQASTYATTILAFQLQAHAANQPNSCPVLPDQQLNSARCATNAMQPAPETSSVTKLLLKLSKRHHAFAHALHVLVTNPSALGILVKPTARC
jgi:hypothetical protein